MKYLSPISSADENDHDSSFKVLNTTTHTHWRQRTLKC